MIINNLSNYIMNNKTAIQELIEIVEMNFNNGVETSMTVFHGMLKQALEKEREQIELAYMEGVCSIYELEVCPIDEQDAAKCYYEAQYINNSNDKLLLSDVIKSACNIKPKCKHWNSLFNRCKFVENAPCQAVL